MPGPETDLSRLSPEELQEAVSKRSASLAGDGMLPNGLQQLIYGSMAARPMTLFIESGANQGKFRGDPGYEELWKSWIETYDPYTGENLTGTALYQHRRYSAGNRRFPQPDTEEYQQLIAQMAELGSYVRILVEKLEWHNVSRILTEIDYLHRHS